MVPYNAFITPPYQPNNPTDIQRYAMARKALADVGRPEDFEIIFSLLASPPDIATIAKPGEFKGGKVGIIGAGLAGLSSAFELRKLGFDVTIFEAMEDRVGGRVFTFYFDRPGGLYGELGAARIPVTHETVWHYIKLFQLSTRPFIFRNENALIYLRDICVRNDPQGKNVMEYIYPKYDLKEWERNTPWQQLVYYGIDSHMLSARPEVRSEILQVMPHYHFMIEYWDYQNMRKMLENTKLSEDAISLISNLSPLAGSNLYNNYIDFIEEDYPVNLAYLYEISGGLSNLPYAFYQSLQYKGTQRFFPHITEYQLGNVDIRMGHWVTGIYKNRKDGKVTIAYSLNGYDKRGSENFDFIVCAIPFSALRTMEIEPLFSERKMQAIEEVNYIPAHKTLLLCNRRFWEEGGKNEQIFGGASFTDLPVRQIWYPSDHAQYCYQKQTGVPYSYSSNHVFDPGISCSALAKRPGVLLASYNFNLDTTRLTNMPENRKIDEIKRDVEKVHGLPRGYLDKVVIGSKTINWDELPSIRGGLCYYSEEQKRIFSYVTAQPEYDSRVFFAGEHTSAVHRWMQGALQTGMLAANNIAKVCKKKR